MAFYCKVSLKYETGILVDLHLQLEEVEELDVIESLLENGLEFPESSNVIIGPLHPDFVRNDEMIAQTTGATTKGLVSYSIVTNEGDK